MDSASRLSAERNTEHFSHLSIKKMQRIMHFKRYAANDLIFFEGDPMNKLFFVKEGFVKLTKLNDAGKNLVFHYFFPQDLFGEFNPNREQPSPFTARAEEDCVIGVMNQNDFETLLINNSDLAIEFTQWQSYMQRFTQLKLRDLLFHGKDGALAAAILRTANTFGVQHDERTLVTKKFTNHDYAEMVGASRETVNRLLLSFKRMGAISYKSGRIEILDTPKLKELCHCEECPVSICRL